MSKIYNESNFERWVKLIEKEDRIIIQDLKRGSMINMEGYDIIVPAKHNGKQVYLPDDCSYLFAGLPVPYLSNQEITIDLSNIVDTSNVTNIMGMFQGYPANGDPNGDDYHPLKPVYLASSVSKINLGNFNSSNVTNMESLFSNCANLKSVNVEVLDTSNVTNMSYMFAQCRSLEELNLVNFNTEKVQDMSSMFKGCSGLKTIDLSRFKTDNVKEIYEMFNYCVSLKEIKGFENLNFKNVENCSKLFEWCESLETINLSSLGTIPTKTRTSGLFWHCYSLGDCAIPDNIDDDIPQKFNEFITDLTVESDKYEDIIKMTNLPCFIPSEVYAEARYRSPRENLSTAEGSTEKTNYFS